MAGGRIWYNTRRHEKEKGHPAGQVLPSRLESGAQGVFPRRRGEEPFCGLAEARRVLLLREGACVLLHVQPHPRLHIS